MATQDDDSRGEGGRTTLPVVPALPRLAAASGLPEDPTPAATEAPEALGFNLRFEAGRALLALENRNVSAGVEVKRALFEVPDVAFPLDVTGGAQRFQQKRLTLRAVELSIAHASLFVPEKLKAAGFTLVRERSRAGALELLVEVDGPAGAVPVRARGVFVPVGEAGCALVFHELISFGRLPRARLELCASLLDALALPGALPARAMVKRAEPFRAVLSRLLPRYGWKVPALGEVRVHEVVLGKGEITLRAWARDMPDGWKAPREAKRGPLEDAVALAVFADGLMDAPDDAARIAVVDRLIDDRALAPSVIAFAADVVRTDARRAAEADDLITEALKLHPEHTGLLAAAAEIAGLTPLERANRLAALGRAAELGDEPWVAARAFLAAARAAEGADELAGALRYAESAYLADPALPETGALFSDLLARSGDLKRAVSVGRTALERAERAEDAESFAVRLARMARQVEGPDAARVLLRRALRRADRADALIALIELEVDGGALERAAELLTRLLVVVDAKPGTDGAVEGAARADVEQLAARIAEARGDREAARMHLQKAQRLRPTDARIAVRLATLLDDGREDSGVVDRALEVLRAALDDASAARDALVLAARLHLRRSATADAERALALLSRVAERDRDLEVRRLHAEAEAQLGRPSALAAMLAEEAAALPPAQAADKQLEAANLWLRAGAVDSAATAFVFALPHNPHAVGDALVRAGDDALPLARAMAQLTAEGTPDPMHIVAGRLAAVGKAREGHVLLSGLGDRTSVELRAGFAEAAGDVALEVTEREALLALVGDGDPRSAAWWRRLGDLHVRPGGGGAGAAADAHARAASLGAADLQSWLEAALASGDGARLAAVLRRDDVEVAQVPTPALRAALAALSAEEDRPMRRRVAAALAARAERMEDVDAWLAEARTLEPVHAAHALQLAAVQHGRAAWLLEAARILADDGQRDEALALLRGVTGVLAEDGALREEAFAIALVGDDAATIAATAEHALATPALDGRRRSGIHRRRMARLLELAPDRALDAAAAWLDDEPGNETALAVLVPARLAAGETHTVVARLDDACRGGPAGPSLVVLIEATAAAAHKRGVVEDEIRARELLVDAQLAEHARAPELERLADLYAEAGRPDRAVDVLHARVALTTDTDDAARAELYLRIAHLEEHQLKRLPRAADALRGRLKHAPDDAGASRRLQSLLEATGDDAGLSLECLRRAARLGPSAERTELLLKAGDAALRSREPGTATVVWLRALRSPPFSKEALQRLLDLGRVERNRRLAVRARVVAAQTLAAGKSADVVAAAEMAAEAGAYLAGVMNRPRLALLCFRFAEARDKKPARHTRVLVDLLRALGDSDGALAALGRLLDKAKDRDKALLHEARADILEQLKGDIDGAAVARRAALDLDPTQKTSARSLARTLRARGDVRGALAVDRGYAEAALTGPALAAAYAVLAAEAEDDLADLALAADLGGRSLALARDADVLRRHARVLESMGRAPEAVEALGQLLALEDALPLDERVLLIQRKARIEREDLGRREEARRTLRAALEVGAIAEHREADRLVDELARAEEELDEPAAAAALLLDVLAERADGTPALGTRTQVLERVGILLDDAREGSRAFAALDEAARLDGLGRAGELRRARLAEELARHDAAERSLDRLLALGPDAEQRVALLGRRAVAAERAGKLDSALSAWAERNERIPGDVEALRAIERLAVDLGRPGEARSAAEGLARLEVGSDPERRTRMLWLARDARERLQDASLAVQFFQRARALGDDAALRLETWSAAEQAGDTGTALALLTERQQDGLSTDELLRRASLRLAMMDGRAPDEAGGALVFDDVLAAVTSAASGEDAAAGGAASGASDTSQGGAVPERAAVLLAALWRSSPDAAWQHLRARAEAKDAGYRALRRALPDDLLADDTRPAPLLFDVASAEPRDVALVRAAARRERAAGQVLRAADRLIALADALAAPESTGVISTDMEASEEARRALHDASEAILDGAGASAVLARIDAIRPALVGDASLRGKALVVLRDAEAWDAVAQVLEEALVVLSGAEQRAARMELISVLRTGVGSEARAAPHLLSLVEADPDDREAWGELFECLDALGDSANLAEALGRRARRATGIERRELVRRRATLLVAAGRGADVLDEVVSVRRENPADAELFALERRIHESVGGVSLAVFLDAELMRTPDAAVASQLLALAPDTVERAARVRAHLVLATSEDGARSRAEHVLDARLSMDDALLDLVAVATRLDGDRRAAFLAGAAQVAGAHGSRAALRMADALREAGVVEAVRAFGLSTVARRLRLAGPTAAAADAIELRRSATDERTRAAAALAALHLALRRRDRAAAREVLEDAAVVLGDSARAAILDMLAGADALTARAELGARAELARLDAATSTGAVAAAVRLGDERVALSGRSPVLLRAVARRTRHLRLTPARLASRLRLAPFLEDSEAVAALRGVVSVALSAGRGAEAAEALDALMARGEADTALLVQRADVALEASASDAALHAMRAADALGRERAAGSTSAAVPEIRLRRRAVELMLRAGHHGLGDALRALAALAPDDAALQAETLGLASAAGLNELADELMATQAEHSAGAEARTLAIRRRADHRLQSRKDAAGAFRVLLEGAAGGDRALREDAYMLAAREGLVEEQVEVVDDDLGRAALLALLGRRREAIDLAVHLQVPAAWLLLAELAAADGDLDSEAAALEQLSASGAADATSLAMLVRLDVRRGRMEEAAQRAVELLERAGASPDRVSLLLDVAGGGAGAARTMDALRALVTADAVPAALLGRALDVWEAAATVTGTPADVRAARLRRCRERDDDGLWLEFFVMELQKLADDERAVLLKPLLGRTAVVVPLVERLVPGLAEGLRALVVAGDAQLVSETLIRVEATAPLSWELRDVLGAALERLGRTREAAEAVARGGVAGHEVGVRAARAAALFLQAGRADDAVGALLAVPFSQLDGPLLQLARETAAAGSERGAVVAVRIAARTGDEADVAAAFAAAKFAPADVAVAVAGWRLRKVSTDARAWRLVAQRGSGAAQHLFATLLAVWCGEPWPEAPGADGERIRRHRAGQLPAHVAAGWVRAATPRSALAHARGHVPAARKRAWMELAAAAGADEVAAARFLARAGVPLSEAPIEVRLAADPALAAPEARVGAVAAALHDRPSTARLALLRRELEDLDARGAVSAATRRAAFGPSEDLKGLIDAAALGEGVEPARVLRALGRGAPGGAVAGRAVGRHASPAARTTAAALLASEGHTEIACLVDARIEARSSRGPSSEKLEERAVRAAQAGALEEAVGLLLLVTGIRGVDRQREERIREIATDLARFDLVTQSLGRSAFSTEGEARARYLLARADLRVRKLDDPDGALRDAAYAASLSQEPGAARVYLELAESTDDVHAVRAALDLLAARNLEPDERRRIAVKRARLLIEDMGDPKAGLEQLDAVLAHGPRDVDQHELHELQGVAYERTGRHANAAAAFLAASVHVEGVERVRLSRRAADAFVAAGLPDLAVDALCRAQDASALLDAETLARTHGSPAALDQALAAQLTPQGGGPPADAHRRRLITLERARLLAEKLGQRPAAVSLLEQQALEDPADVGARIALAEWYVEERRVLDAALAYESAARIADLPMAVTGAAAREAAALLGALGDLARGGPLAEQALGSGVVDLKVLAVAEAWHRAEGRFDKVDELLEREIALEPDGRKQATVYMERAALRAERLGDPTGAHKMLLAALDLDPAQPAALDMMRAEAARESAWGALRAALSRAAEVAQPQQERGRLFKEIAALDLERFHDSKAAEVSIDRALELLPGDGDALLFKAQILVSAGQVEGVPSLLERAERAGVRSFPGALNIVRGDGLVLSGDREGAREAFFQATRDAATATRAWDRLIDLAEGTPHVMLVLEEARDASSDPERILALLRKEIRVRHKGGDDDGALRLLEELLAAEPGDSEALQQVREAYTRRRKLAPLVPLLHAHALAADGPERAQRLAALGAFLLEEIGNEAQARQAFEDALAEDPHEPRALLGLADVVWAARDDERALELLDRITPAQWPRAPTELLYRRARCAYALGRDDAPERLRAVLRVDAGHQDALQMLAQLALLRNDDDAAEFALEALTSAIPPREDPVRLAQAYLDLAALRGRQGKHAEALVAAERAFELDPSRAETLEGLAHAREGAGRAADAAEAWRRLAALRSGAARLEALERRVGQLIRAERTGDAFLELVELRRETGLSRFKQQAEDLARESGDVELMRRAGVEPPAPPIAADPPTTATTPAQGAGPATADASFAALPVTAPGGHVAAQEPIAARVAEPAVPSPVVVDVPARVAPQVREEHTHARIVAPAQTEELVLEPTKTQGFMLDSDAAAASGGVKQLVNALHMQVRANLEENDPRTALRLVGEALTAGQCDAALLTLAEEVAGRGKDWQGLLEMLEARLRVTPDPMEAKLLARTGGRIAREHLVDLDRAAGLLYQAHQADAEDIEVRLELTELYALIPRLAGHAVTGILQLLRRTPADERVFKLAADLAASQQQGERAQALRAVEGVLGGRGFPAEVTRSGALDARVQVLALDVAGIAARIAPTGWGSPLQSLITLCGSAIDVALFGEGTVPSDARLLHELAPRSALALDRVERLLPGRPLRIFCAKVERLTVVPGAVPTVLVPVDLVGLGDAALIAAVGRAVALVRFSHPIVELLQPGDEQQLLLVLHAAFVAGAPDARAERLLTALSEGERAAGRALAAQVFPTPPAPIDVAGTLGIMLRGADRFALVASGDVLATADVSCLPGLLRESPQRARALLAGSPRALELAAFAARDNAWLVRRQQGLTP